MKSTVVLLASLIIVVSQFGYASENFSQAKDHAALPGLTKPEDSNQSTPANLRFGNLELAPKYNDTELIFDLESLPDNESPEPLPKENLHSFEQFLEMHPGVDPAATPEPLHGTDYYAPRGTSRGDADSYRNHQHRQQINGF
ncbi:MAG: hypothetical protein H6626_01215 [Pseudobdellovibrionaceae bacterium]|nr:hypothetical protein [Bdellovibrionales bacterium]USN47743.1 MAG: hypothetical protein H6626_01215 [Pseudobdellovibrionaceae bacterium]